MTDYMKTTVHLSSGKTLTHSDPINWDEMPAEAGDDPCTYLAQTIQKAGVKIEQIGPHYLNWDNVEAITFEIEA